MSVVRNISILVFAPILELKMRTVMSTFSFKEWMRPSLYTKYPPFNGIADTTEVLTALSIYTFYVDPWLIDIVALPYVEVPATLMFVMV